MAGPRGVKRAELVVSLGVLALGVAALLIALSLPAAGGYARIGPNFVPVGVAGGVVLLGLWLLWEVFSGGWRVAVPDDPEARGDHAFLPSAFLWVCAGLLAQMVLIRAAGFPIAAMALFVCVARGFGSTRWLRDAGVGMAIGVLVFLFFVRFLNVNLPAGWLLPVLGTAGL